VTRTGRPHAGDELQRQAAAFATQSSNLFGGNPALARSTKVPGLGGTEIVVPGNDGICLLEVADGASLASGGTCGNTADALAARIYLITVCGPGLQQGKTRVSGLVPDDIGRLTLRDTAGNSSSQAPHENVFAFEVADPPSTLVYTDTDGHEQTLDVNVGESGSCASKPLEADRVPSDTPAPR
jgi:hypothetical protein